ncbi:hypothetical protein KAT36_03135 [Candidatus Pacearchaeota archaeon]|nr:hypothetical protein [Candidatus Pacearchaeota archaeon]
MGLRKYINDLEFSVPLGFTNMTHSSRNVNYSNFGKWFENNDFVRSGALTRIVIGDVFQKEDWSYKGVAMGFTLISPIIHLVMYGMVKREKWKKSSLYDDFSDSPDLILNH